MTTPKLQKDSLEMYNIDTTSTIRVPMIEGGISAGFPSPAEDFSENKISLDDAYIKNPSTTICARVSGDSMVNAGMSDGDLIIVDRSLEIVNNKIAVCHIDGEFLVKRIKIEKDIVWLVAENKKYKPIKVTIDNEFIVWGIVTTIIKSV